MRELFIFTVFVFIVAFLGPLQGCNQDKTVAGAGPTQAQQLENYLNTNTELSPKETNALIDVDF